MSKISNLQELIILVYLYYSDIENFQEDLKKPFQLYIKSVALMIEEARLLFESTPPQLVDDVTAHFRRIAEEDTSKLLDRPPQFSSVHRIQTRRQAKSQVT
jgi:hypothetical protein